MSEKERNRIKCNSKYLSAEDAKLGYEHCSPECYEANDDAD